MNKRKLALGDRNLVGARVTEARLQQSMTQTELLAKLQLQGIEISIPALSLLEGQKRPVTDRELVALSQVLNVTVDWLLGLNPEEDK
ncbi:MAG: helix-turn-helix domain-containing protein [Candidatus Onthomonas sp.]